MKKAIIFVVVFVCLFSVITVYVLNIKRVKMDFVEDVDVCFVYGSTDVLCRLGDEEIETIKAIFNEKKRIRIIFLVVLMRMYLL